MYQCTAPLFAEKLDYISWDSSFGNSFNICCNNFVDQIKYFSGQRWGAKQKADLALYIENLSQQKTTKAFSHAPWV